MQSAEQVLIDSANAAIGTVETDDFAKLTKYARGLTGAEVSRHIQPTDEPGLFSPVDVEKDGKDRAGSILALSERAIIAWTVGTFRIKNYEIVIPSTSIKTLEQRTRPGGAMSKDREVLYIETSDGVTWNLAFPNAFDGGRSIVPWLEGVLTGALKPVFDAQS
jgi:hypothetical protein